jgi:membrane associated rhomboid family serine protease
LIPLRDENPASRAPVVTRALIVVNTALFLYELAIGPELREFMLHWGLVPVRLTWALAHGTEPVVRAGTPLLTSMFLHGGWMHLIGNMWYLSLFGDNVEDRLGRVRYLGFYLLAGLTGGLLHYAFNRGSEVPTVGASGAIAGVLGAYAVAFPRARVLTLVPLFPFFQLMALPALVVLGLRFQFQFVTGALSLAWSASGGVAWWGHIGGFLFGVLAMALLGGTRSHARSAAWVEP